MRGFCCCCRRLLLKWLVSCREQYCFFSILQVTMAFPYHTRWTALTLLGGVEPREVTLDWRHQSPAQTTKYTHEHGCASRFPDRAVEHVAGRPALPGVTSLVATPFESFSRSRWCSRRKPPLLAVVHPEKTTNFLRAFLNSRVRLNSYKCPRNWRAEQRSQLPSWYV